MKASIFFEISCTFAVPAALALPGLSSADSVAAFDSLTICLICSVLTQLARTKAVSSGRKRTARRRKKNWRMGDVQIRTTGEAVLAATDAKRFLKAALLG